VLLGVPRARVITPGFFAATLGAGLFVSALNHGLARGVVGSRVQDLAGAMRRVEGTLRAMTARGEVGGCDPETCRVPVDSDDELGEVAGAFNALVDALARSHAANALTRRLGEVLAAHQELEALAGAFLAELTDATGLPAAALLVRRGPDLEVVAATGLSDAGALAASAPVRRVERELVAVEVRLPADVVLDAAAVRFRPRTVVVLPVSMRGVLIGVLLLASTTEIEADLRGDVERVLPNLAVALNNAVSFERLQQVAACDPLTGCYNRRFGLRRLTEEFERAVRSSEPLGLLLFDLDHFKTINDVHGHQMGDRVLQAAARAARRVLRDGDVLMRYGGEEFVAVLPGAGPGDLLELGERIRRAVAETALADGHDLVRVTVSVGAAAFPSSGVGDVDDLLRVADEAMYRAKTAGRDQLALAAGR
jgi:diguanylate cyclase (GGDEF)-like protein